jgi:hypothetical protein
MAFLDILHKLNFIFPLFISVQQISKLFSNNPNAKRKFNN